MSTEGSFQFPGVILPIMHQTKYGASQPVQLASLSDKKWPYMYVYM